MPGTFITFEGIEGSGKTTQIRLLAKALEQKKLPIVLTREPGGTEIGDRIRTVLLNPDFHAMHPMTELFLYAAARCQHIHQVIRPALDAGKIVLCDRYADATTAYQGFGRAIDLGWLRQLHQLATGNLNPDLTLLLDCPVASGLKRAVAREAKQTGVAEDRFEQEKKTFHEKVRQGYLHIAKEEPKRVHIIDADGGIQEIHERILKVVALSLRGMK